MQTGAYGTIYKITNNVNGKVYIGQTTMDFGHRYSAVQWWRAIRNFHLKSSIIKYGSENFTVDNGFDIAYSKEQLNEREVYWINLYDSTNCKLGYNKKHGGSNGKHTKETLEKLTIANIRIGLLRKGIRRSKEICQHIKLAKYELFVKRFPKSYSETIQELLNKGMRKQDICVQCGISIYQLDRMIEIYNLSHEFASSMKGNNGEKHHHFGKHNTTESKKKVSETFNKSFEEKYGKEVARIDKMLKDKVSISEISRIYGCGRPTIRKVIKHYGLESFGLNVKKHKIA